MDRHLLEFVALNAERISMIFGNDVEDGTFILYLTFFAFHVHV